MHGGKCWTSHLVAPQPLSHKDFERARTFDAVNRGELTVAEAAECLALSRRQCSRLLANYRRDGIAGIVSKKIGKTSNNRTPRHVIESALERFRSDLSDYGPTLASEVLANEYGIHISRETLRKALIEANLWLPHLKPSERQKLHQPRQRRDFVGELIQIDGSTHPWIAGRPDCCLFVFIDDATSRLMTLHLEETETTLGFFRAWMSYLRVHGRPQMVYGDRGGAIFRIRKGQGADRDFRYQHARALRQLGIACQPAFTKQARGRVERVHRTLQDRLVKFLRRRGVKTIDEANALLPEYLIDHNNQFARDPRFAGNKHSPLTSFFDPETILSVQQERTASAKLSVPYKGRQLILLDSPAARKAIRRKVVIHEHCDGHISVRVDGAILPHLAVIGGGKVDRMSGRRSRKSNQGTR